MRTIKQLFMLCLFWTIGIVTNVERTFANEIWYEANEKLEVTASSWSSGLHTNAFNTSISSHTFSNGWGVITFSGNVTSIGEYAFYQCSSLTSITIPNSVKSIGNYAFYGCTGITSVTIPNSVTSIGDNPFGNCTGLTSMSVATDNSKYDSRDNCNAIIETSTNRLISGCKETVIPNSITIIGYRALFNSSNLTSIVIPTSVTSIEVDAFAGCSGLTSVTIPNSVTSIGEGAFSSCNSLPIENNLRYADTYLVGAVDKTLSKYTIKESTKWIGSSAFSNCSDLTSVTIPNSVTSIGESAFSNCSALTSITIPNSVTSIGNFAFYFCSGLTSITIPNSVTSIGNNAFYNCSDLTSVAIPNSVTSIGEYSFCGCSGLTSVTIPNSVKSIGWFAFYGCSGLTSVTIGNSVTSIGEYAFCGCSGLTSITIPNSVTSIGDYAFNNCSGLSKVFCLADALSSVGTNAFSSSPYVFVPFGSKASYSSWSSYTLTEVYYVDGCAYQPSGESFVFRGYYITPANTSNIVIPSSVEIEGINTPITSIGSKALYEYNVKSLTIGSNISSISYTVFNSLPIKTTWLAKQLPSGCSNAMGNINYVPNTNYSSLSNAVVYPYLNSSFESNGVKYVVVNPSQKTCDVIDCDYSATNNELNIGANVLYKGISMTVNNVDKYAFYGNDSLVNVSVRSKGIIDNYAFASCPNIKSFTIGENVTSVGNYVFSACNSLSSVVIKDRNTSVALGSNGTNSLFVNAPLDSVYIGGMISYNSGKDYGYSPFAKNATLRTVTISDNETAISNNQFYGCSSLEGILIGSSVASIGVGAFSECANLKSIVCKSVQPPLCQDNALDDIDKFECVVKVPEQSIENYQLADQWMDFFFIEGYLTSGANVKVINNNDEEKETFVSSGSDFTVTDTYKMLNVFDNIDNVNITYSRTFKNTNWQPLYVPFDMDVTSELLTNFSFAKYAGTYTEDDGTFCITIAKLKEGDKVKANTPYFIKAKVADSSNPQAISVAGTTLHATAETENYMLSAEKKVSIFGIYNKKTFTAEEVAEKNVYGYGGGTYNPQTAGQTLGAFRFYIKLTNRENNMYGTDTPSSIKLKVLGDEDDEATGIDALSTDTDLDNNIYDLSGRAVSNPKHGVYIKNGKKYYVK